MGSPPPNLALKSAIGFTGSICGGLHYLPCGKFVVFPLGSVAVLKSLSTKKQYFLDAGVDKNVSCVAISGDGRYLACGHETTASFKAEVLVWDLNRVLRAYAKNEELSKDCVLHTLFQHYKRVESVDFSCDGRHLATLGGLDDNDLVVWDCETGVAVCGSPAATDASHCVKWLHGRNDRFVTCGQLHVRVWQVCVKTPRLHPINVSLGTLRRDLTCLAISTDDAFAFAGNSTGEVVKIDIRRDEIKPFDEPEVFHPRIIGYNTDRFGQGVKSVACVVNPNTGNTNVIAGAGDGTVNILNPQLKRIPSHTCKLQGAVTSISLHPDGRTFLAGTESSQRYSVDISTFTPELRETAHFGGIHDVCFPRASSEIFVTASEQDIRVWSAKKKQELLRIDVPNVTCYAIDVTDSGQSIVSGWSDGRIRSFYPQSGRLQFMIPDAHAEAVRSLAIVKGGECDREEKPWQIMSGGGDGRVRVWRIYEKHQVMLHSMKEHRGSVNSIVCNSDGSQAVSASADGSCIVWNIERGVRITALYDKTVFRSVLYHPDESQYLTASSANRIGYFCAFAGEPVRFINGGGDVSQDVTSLAIFGDGQYYLSGSADKVLRLWHYDDGRQVASAKGHSGTISKVKLSPDEKTIVSVGMEGGIFLWGLDKMRQPT